MISARIEEELAQLDESERLEYLQSMGLEEPGLNRLIEQGYHLLDLITYFTCGPKETRAWTEKRINCPSSGGDYPYGFRTGLYQSRDHSLPKIMWPAKGKAGHAKQASSDKKAKNTSSKTEM